MAKIDKVINSVLKLSFASFFYTQSLLTPADYFSVSVAWSDGRMEWIISPPGWDTGSLQGYSWHPVIHRGGVKTAKSFSFALEDNAMQAAKPKRWAAKPKRWGPAPPLIKVQYFIKLYRELHNINIRKIETDYK